VNVVAITGASGFVGQALVRYLDEENEYRLNLLTRETKKLEHISGENVHIYKGDLLDKNTIDQIIEPGCTIINLSYLGPSTKGANIVATTNLIETGIKKCVNRIIHCSTAAIVGKNKSDMIDEDTVCNPTDEYEITKFEIERLFLEKASGNYDIGILRPTAIFGPQSRNLIKFADSLYAGNQFINGMRSVLFGKRKLNIVCLENVLGALKFLTEKTEKLYGDIFNISDDDDPLNNYYDVQNILLERFGKSKRNIPIFLPPFFLKLLLSIKGRSNTNPYRIYSSDKLLSAGYKRPIKFETGLINFANWYIKQMPT
jgi:nucleoside-diphosphate-sugar epimerase